ncbi:sugar transferase [Erythrobacter insulae]|uniref:Sugar transferase n=1 Tax=Erythrobacter insulae TaxID=2584124 RepID=A0A547PBJ5_9SPHN|nr:sugar transferase [Erythrobacter insulae]TRD11404.1 sugar transferase [Erythrobacter insulae]
MLLQRVPVETRSSSDWLARRDIQLLLYLAAGLGNPAVIWLFVRGQPASVPLFINTLIALTIAIVVSWHALSRIREYAKARQLSYVFPINILSFGGVLVAIAILRSSYSISLFVAGAMGAIIVSYMLSLYNRRLRRPHFIVSGGRSSEIRLEGQFIPAPELVELESLVQAKRLNASLVADLHYDHPDEWERLFAKAALAGVPVYHYRQVAEMQSGQVKITHLAENDLGSLIPNVPYMSSKRLIDIAGSLMLLPFLLCAFVIIALLIRLDSKGNPFFIQERVGFRGETFRMLKFRTMKPRGPITDAGEQRDDAMTKSDDDRITRLGRFLRKTRIDELPQVFNILRGEMSWIGPRPEAKALSQWYESELPFYSYRHIVRPGITGWAQVTQGHVTEVSDVNSKLRFDFYYVKNISLWLDFLIVLKTFRVIFTGNGAK